MVECSSFVVVENKADEADAVKPGRSVTVVVPRRKADEEENMSRW